MFGIKAQRPGPPAHPPTPAPALTRPPRRGSRGRRVTALVNALSLDPGLIRWGVQYPLPRTSSMLASSKTWVYTRSRRAKGSTIYGRFTEAYGSLWPSCRQASFPRGIPYPRCNSGCTYVQAAPHGKPSHAGSSQYRISGMDVQYHRRPGVSQMASPVLAFHQKEIKWPLQSRHGDGWRLHQGAMPQYLYFRSCAMAIACKANVMRSIC